MQLSNTALKMSIERRQWDAYFGLSIKKIDYLFEFKIIKIFFNY